MRGYLTHRYLLALGSNMRVARCGGPRRVLAAAVAALEALGVRVEAQAPIMITRPVGPSRRAYANGAAVIATALTPPDLLRLLQQTEARFGRRRRGQRWRSRPLDLDIILWSGGRWQTPALTIPHPRWQERPFVLCPAAAIARDWRAPASPLRVRHHLARLTRPRPLPR